MAEKNATLTLPTGEVIDLPVLKDHTDRMSSMFLVY